ncbi:hypothetical protein ACIGXM_14695 [Kitasatospora sp. NPDC052896]|uniref:hypothetical protein n=1 Tax=Kitasatospora sp. NPDC052896 TaxID=3364061 RepID=UPI0037C6F22E
MRPSLSASTKAAIREFINTNPTFADCRREKRHVFPKGAATAMTIPKNEGGGWLVTEECDRCGTFRRVTWDQYGRRTSGLRYEWPDGYREDFQCFIGDDDAAAALNLHWIKGLPKLKAPATVHQLPVRKVA